jgi:hypothetical protein
LPGRLATFLLLVLGFGALLAWIVAPMVLRDQTGVLSGFLDGLQQRSRDLAPDSRVAVALPRLHAGETIMLAMGPSATTLRPDLGLSKRAFSTVRDDLAADGAELTFVYLVVNGEVTGRERISRCNLSIAGREALVLSAATRTAFLECGPASAWAPGECRDFAGLWNERCRPRLVLQ